MPALSLTVTRPVLDQLAAGRAFQSQIAIKDATDHLEQLIGSASANNTVELRLGGVLPLTLGDTGAIWRAHQGSPASIEAYDHLFKLLALHPDQWLRLVW